MNMGHSFEADPEGSWGYQLEPWHFRAIREAGFDTVRLPIKWDSRTDNRPPYRINPRFMTRIIEVVKSADASGLGVIIDVHNYEGLIENPKRETAKFKAIWHQISRAFAGAPAHIYFELINEPTNISRMEDINQLYAQIIPIIREIHPTLPLIIGGNHWNSVETMETVNWNLDPYLVATFHDYGPHEFTHQGAFWEDNPPPMGRRWGGAPDIAELEDTYKIAKRFQDRFGIPVFVGEFGVIEDVPMSERVRWTKARRQAIERAGFSWCAWDFAGGFETYNLAARNWHPGMRDALTGR